MLGRNARRELALDESLDVLANRYRRRLLVALLDHNPQDDDDAQLPPETIIEDGELARLESTIAHVHLPKLADAGFIEWDRAANVIRVGPRFEEIRPLLELLTAHRDELPVEWL